MKSEVSNWPTGNMKNKDVAVELYDRNGKLAERAVVDAELWFDGNAGVCKGTGRWFVALDFGSLVDQQSQWMPSPAPALAVPLPEDPTAKDEVLAAIADNANIADWLVEIGADETGPGYTAITNFTGDQAAIEMSYLLDILPDSNPEVELTMPSITFDENGLPVVEGELLNHGTEVQTTVRGQARLYYADSLEDLETTTNYIQISPPTFPVTTTNDVTGAQIPAARFYRLKIE